MNDYVHEIAPLPTPQESLMDYLCELDSQINALTTESDELFVILQKPFFGSRTPDQKEEFAERENKYWSLMANLQEVRPVLAAGMLALEGYEAGTVSEEDLQELLPKAQNDQQAKEAGKKAGLTRGQMAVQALMAEHGIDRWDARAMLEEQGRGVAATDSRRIASGRNRTRVTAVTDNPLQAEANFMYYTADTHGGKSRRPGKGATHYVGASGRRIRKR